MSKITTSDFQKGMFIEFKGETNQIVEFQFVNPGKGSAFARTKLKNLKTGRVQEFTYKSGEAVVEIPINVREMQYIYREGDNYVFMDEKTFDQASLSKESVGDFAKFIKEGNIYQILLDDGVAIGMRYPQKVRLKVTEAEEGARGNTVTGAKKTVTLETGAKVNVPIFIKVGEVVMIDTSSSEYAGRESTKVY